MATINVGKRKAGKDFNGLLESEFFDSIETPGVPDTRG